MQTEQTYPYEQAFESFLSENKTPFIWVDQSKRPEFFQSSVKNFDFLLHPDSQSPILVELKGRTFKGDSLAGLKGLDGWATFEDVQALSQWLQRFRSDYSDARAYFVFAFRFENIDVETDGHDVYDYLGQRYLFLAIPLEKYAAAKKVRSPKWQTVTLPAEDFRRWALPIADVLLPQRTQRFKR
ncbi:MAG: HYExAFE family protein [Planctomycetota bacterium]|jgi:hypothetical protein